MTHPRKIATFVISLLILVNTATVFAESYGAAGAAAAAAAADGAVSLSISEMLRYAVEDEYLARAEYVAIMKKYDVARPFSNIKEAEDQHIAWLSDIFAARGLELPVDVAASHVVVPTTLREAYEIGVQAEIINIDMYERFLKNPLFANGANADVKALFERLARSSENHLRAFRTQLAKY